MTEKYAGNRMVALIRPLIIIIVIRPPSHCVPQPRGLRCARRQPRSRGARRVGQRLEMAMTTDMVKHDTSLGEENTSENTNTVTDIFADIQSKFVFEVFLVEKPGNYAHGLIMMIGCCD